MSTNWSDGASAISAVFSAVTAGVALRLAKQNNEIGESANRTAEASNRAADAANRTADAVARIEQQRWHIELTPRFDITLADGDGDRAKLHIYLAGPEIAYTPTNSSWLNRIEAQFTALRYFTLDGTDHATHKEQGSMIRRYIIWRNRHADDRRLRAVVDRANVA